MRTEFRAEQKIAEFAQAKQENFDIKKNRLEELKKAIVEQHLGLSGTVNELFEQASVNPDISKEELYVVLKKAAEKYNFTDEQIQHFGKAIESFFAKKKAVSDLLEVTHDPQEIFKYCLGFEARGTVEVRHKGMCLMLICQEPQDFLRAYARKAKIEDIDDKTKRKAGLAAAAALGWANKSVMIGAITISRVCKKKVLDDNFVHEEQHQFNRLFKPQNERLGFDVERLQNLLTHSHVKDEEKAYKLIQNFVIETRIRKADRKAHDEVIASYKDGSSTEDIYKKMHHEVYKFLEEADLGQINNEIRDYFDQIRLNKAFKFEQEGKAWTTLNYRPYLPKKPERLKYMRGLLNEGYFKNIKTALEAVKELEDSGYNRKDIISFLNIISLDRWKVFARRLKEYENKYGSTRYLGRLLKVFQNLDFMTDL